MPIRHFESSKKVWDETNNPDIPRLFCLHKETKVVYEPFKLHISIDPVFFEKPFKQLTELLNAATDAGHIPAYKVLKSKFFRNKDLYSTNRALNLPWVIYLHQTCDSRNSELIISLCEKIEAILKKVPAGNPHVNTTCDLPLSPHLVFRQCAHAKNIAAGEAEYISSGESKELALQLAAEGKTSPWYQCLRSKLAPKAYAFEEKKTDTSTSFPYSIFCVPAAAEVSSPSATPTPMRTLNIFDEEGKATVLRG